MLSLIGLIIATRHAASCAQATAELPEAAGAAEDDDLSGLQVATKRDSWTLIAARIKTL
jgi:hypothetical protein